MTEPLVTRTTNGAVSILTLNRPDKLNALSPELFQDLSAHLDDIEAAGEAVGCVILRGSGRAFSAGADVEALKAGVVTDDPEFRSKTVERIGRIAPVVIAAVHGYCYTGGLELALACDVIVAAADSRFRDTHAKLGIVPRWGLSARLPRRVGLATARRISLSGEAIDAGEALRIGLCDYVVAPDELQGFAEAMAARIAEQKPASIAAIRHLYDRSLTTTLAEALDYERAFTAPTATRLA